jgi:uncharacterized SAM-binding protein YcdF (DUF218 family)
VGRSWRKVLKKTALLAALILIIGLAWGSFQYWEITKTGEEASPEPADVIIVLGAAVWPHGPSPALQARLTHAVFLYREGYAENIILSGGLGTHPPTEAEAMQAVMLGMGVPGDALYLEKRSVNTLENLTFSREIMQSNGWQKAIIVSDPFHIKRALLVARDLGIDATGGAAKNSVLYRNRDLRVSHTLREVLALTRYYIFRLLPQVETKGSGPLSQASGSSLPEMLGS